MQKTQPRARVLECDDEKESRDVRLARSKGEAARKTSRTEHSRVERNLVLGKFLLSSSSSLARQRRERREGNRRQLFEPQRGASEQHHYRAACVSARVSFLYTRFYNEATLLS